MDPVVLGQMETDRSHVFRLHRVGANPRHDDF